MKRIIITVLLVSAGLGSFAQRQYVPPTYSSNERSNGSTELSDNRLFIGGSIALGLSNLTFNLGATPEIGYSFNQWLDAGVALNLNYQSIRADPSFVYNDDTRQRSFNYGGGPFVRVFPLRQFFLQAQLEHNWIDYNFLNYNFTPPVASSLSTQSNSFLAGIGFTQRVVGQASFYTVILVDLMNDPNSPYRDYNGNPLPIIRAGFTFYLHAKKK